MKLKALFLTAVISASNALLAQYPIPDQSRVLFVGNSLTGVKGGGVPGYTNAAMAESPNPVQMKWHRVQIWAESLETHWYNNGSNGQANTLVGNGIYANWPTTWINAKDAIEGGHPDGNPWDYVVLQGYSVIKIPCVIYLRCNLFTNPTPSRFLSNFGELRNYFGAPEAGPVSDALAPRLIRGYYVRVSHADAMVGRVLKKRSAKSIREFYG